MSKLRNTLMGTIAAVTIAAASGSVLAQEPQQHNGAPGKQAPAAMQPDKGHLGGTQAQPNRTMSQGASQEKPNGHAQTQPDRQSQPNRNAQTQPDKKQDATGSAQRREDTSRDNRPAENKAGAAENRQSKPNATTAQGRERSNLKGLQGNASGVNVQLNEQQKTQIRTSIIEGRNAPRADHVNFNVAVGTAIPRGGVRIVPVPETLVQIEPGWRGFEYFVYEEEIVIVNPRDMTIVAVLVV